MTEVGSKFLDSLGCEENMLEPEEVGEAGVKIVEDEKTKSGSVWYIHKHGDDAFELPNENTWENLMKHKV